MTDWRPSTPARVAAWSAVALLPVLVAAVAFGFAVYGAYSLGGDSADQDGWTGLAAVVLGLFAAMASAGLLWLVAMWIATLRYISPGHRRPVVLGMLGAALASFAVLVVGGSLSGSGVGGGSWLVGLAGLILLLVPPLLVLLRVRSEPSA